EPRERLEEFQEELGTGEGEDVQLAPDVDPPPDEVLEEGEPSVQALTRGRDGAVEPGEHPPRGALEHRDVFGRSGDLWDELHRGCPRADHGDLPALQRDVVAPPGRVEDLALKIRQPGELRDRRA